MPEIDPITGEALKRASHMRSNQPRSSSPPKPEESPKPEPSEPKPKSSLFGLDALFKDKETSVILLLVVLLMGEKGSEGLLLSLIYLLT